MSKHTKLPWKITDENRAGDIYIGNKDMHVLIVTPQLLGDSTGPANAEYIVRACNSHEDLLKACEKSWKLLQEVARMNIQPFPTMAVDLNNELRELIAKATG